MGAALRLCRGRSRGAAQGGGRGWAQDPLAVGGQVCGDPSLPGVQVLVRLSFRGTAPCRDGLAFGPPR